MAKKKLNIPIGSLSGLLVLGSIFYLLVSNKKIIGEKFRETLGGSSSENSGIPSLDDGSANINRNNGDDSSLPPLGTPIPGYPGPYFHGDPHQQPQAPPTYYDIPPPPPPAPPQSSSLKFYGRQDLQFYRDLGYSAQRAQTFSQIGDTYNDALTSPVNSIYKHPYYLGGSITPGTPGGPSIPGKATAEGLAAGRSNFGTGRTGGTGYQGQGTGSVFSFLSNKPKPTSPTTQKPTTNTNRRFQNLHAAIPTATPSTQQQADTARANRYSASTGRPQPVQSAAANKIQNNYNAYRRRNR